MLHSNQVNPFNNRVLIKKENPFENLDVPENYKKGHIRFSTKATVVTAGLTCEDVKRGDTVIVDPYKGFEVDLADGKYHMVLEKHIQVIL